MRIRGFGWDEGNILHLELKHGITPREAEEVFARKPLFKATKGGHYAAFGPTASGRLLVVVFAFTSDSHARVITSWDMDKSERRYYSKQTER
ncbi:MAG: BrnT family toxin [Candidatus Aureabacteria bacterium]|nr:BrnT family toxin [Candidatus Auribacterota bacterium]